MSGAVIAIIVVVVVVVAGVFAYLDITHKLPGQSSSGAKSNTLVVWQDFSPTEFPAFQSAVVQFEATHPNQTVTWVNETTPSPSNYVAAALAGDAPDVLIGTSDFAGGLYYDGFLANLSKLLPASAFTPFLPVALADNTQSGTVFGIPLNVNGVAMIYNKELVPVAPTNTDQMIQDAKNITTTSGGKIVTAGLIYGLDSDGGYRFPAWQSGFGSTFFNTSGLPNLNNTATVDALEFLNNFTTVDAIEPPGVTSETTYEDQFAEGHVGMIFDGPWDIDTYVAALGATNVGVAPIPMVSQTGDWPEPLWGSIGAYVSARNASGASPALFNESLNFSRFLASPAVEGELFNSSGDIPSLANTFGYVESLKIPFVQGFLDQFFNHSQAFPNLPQISYYWTPFGDEVSDYIAGSITAAQAVSSIQSQIIAEMQQNHIPPE